jgi:hypothetical protein
MKRIGTQLTAKERKILMVLSQQPLDWVYISELVRVLNGDSPLDRAYPLLWDPIQFLVRRGILEQSEKPKILRDGNRRYWIKNRVRIKIPTSFEECRAILRDWGVPFFLEERIIWLALKGDYGVTEESG